MIAIYKSFIRPHLDYGAIIFDQPENESFCKKIESVQYNAALAITGAIQGTSREKLYKELGLETLKSRRWLKKLCCFYKIKNNGIPSYLAELIPLNLNDITLGIQEILQHILAGLMHSSILFFHGR